MSEPQEFWIYDNGFIDKPVYDDEPIESNKFIHVVEYSHYQAVVKQLEAAKAEVEYYYNQRNEFAADLEVERAKSARLVEAVKLVRIQQHGIKNNWAGQWINCVKCNLHWAFGWNWNDLKPDEPCPLCRLNEALEHEAHSE